MKRLLLITLLALSVTPSLAKAQVSVNLNLGLPPAPPLVVVQPGVQVVEDYDEEVFFVRGWYWVRRDGRWYRSRRPHQAFMPVGPRAVPGVIARMPPGHYRHWHHDRGPGPMHDRGPGSAGPGPMRDRGPGPERGHGADRGPRDEGPNHHHFER